VHLSNKRLIVIAGPTGVGKTRFAIQLAQHFKTEIISADSRQLFKELNIGVARPTKEELSTVKHHFIASHSIHEDYNAGKYEREVNECLEQLFVKHDVVVMCGGTGLYIKAATEGLDDLPAQDKELRNELNALFNNSGMEGLLKRLDDLGIDKQGIEVDNPQRVIRAIEINKLKSKMKSKSKTNRAYKCSYYFLNRDREKLYERINQRVDMMLEDGLLKEVKNLHPHKDLNSLKTVGYQELFDAFDGKWTQQEAIEKIKQHTRNYAKRQLTWFRNQGDFKELLADSDGNFSLAAVTTSLQ
jgi:tRNA dimethylallyltransferase